MYYFLFYQTKFIKSKIFLIIDTQVNFLVKKLFGEIGIRNKLKICPQFEMSVQVLQ